MEEPKNLSLSDAPEVLLPALKERGFDRLTAIQAAVLDAETAGRDLRISSQTGSGKTVALGFAIADDVAEAAAGPRARRAEPVSLIIAPTRELASQIADELNWLFAPTHARVMVVTGGTSVVDERRRLARGPHVVVGTPGRLLDHLRRKALVLDELNTVVLDEADEMLDMGFEEELEGILDFAPVERRTHLVSATFPRNVMRLADRMQHDAILLAGTPIGEANANIDHIGMLVSARDRTDAIINLLLQDPEAKTLLFVRTRIGSAELARSLADLGFRSRALNGEMSHRERTQTFADFKSGAVQYLAATDVAARGLDVQDISRVIQVDLPNNADVFTHRCGRTGRAGRTGQNIVLISPKGRYSLERLAKGARVKVRYETVPQREQILAAAEQRVVERAQSPVPPLPEQLELADRLLDGFPAREVLARLLAHMDLNGVCEPRDVRSPEGGKKKRKKDRDRDRGDRDRGDRGRDRFSDNRSDDRGDRPRRPRKDSGDFVKFQVSWGAQRGADPRRLLALVCRRGDLSRDDVGAIRVAPRSSMIEIARGRASDFESIVKRPDPRDPHVHFRRWQDDGPPRREGGGQRRDNKPFRGGRKPPRRKD